jgi:hypothetical protein
MDTRLWAAITGQKDCAVKLGFWARGESYSSLQFLFQISKQTVGQIVCIEIANVDAPMENI